LDELFGLRPLIDHPKSLEKLLELDMITPNRKRRTFLHEWMMA